MEEKKLSQPSDKYLTALKAGRSSYTLLLPLQPRKNVCAWNARVLSGAYTSAWYTRRHNSVFTGKRRGQRQQPGSPTLATNNTQKYTKVSFFARRTPPCEMERRTLLSLLQFPPCRQVKPRLPLLLPLQVPVSVPVLVLVPVPCLCLSLCL